MTAGSENSPLLHLTTTEEAEGVKRRDSNALRFAVAAVVALAVVATVGVVVHRSFDVVTVEPAATVGYKLGRGHPLANAVKEAWEEAKRAKEASRATLADVTVPNRISYIYGAKEQTDNFPFGYFVNIVAAAVQLAPDEIVVHYEFDSPGFWWRMLKQIVTMKQQKMPTGFEGHEIVVDNYSHKTDFLRLQILREQGGIYMDTDILPLRSFDDLRAGNTQFLMCSEDTTTTDQTPHGLGSALLLAAPHSEFAGRWYDHYHTYDASNASWAGMAIEYPLELSKELLGGQAQPTGLDPDLAANPPITILPSDKTFFRPLWDEAGLHQLFVENDFDLSSNYAVHLWGLLGFNFIRALQPKHIIDNSEEPEVTYTRAIKQALPSALRQQLFQLSEGTEGGLAPPRPTHSWLSGSICEHLHWCPKEHGIVPIICKYQSFKRLERLAFGGSCSTGGFGE